MKENHKFLIDACCLSCKKIAVVISNKTYCFTYKCKVTKKNKRLKKKLLKIIRIKAPFSLENKEAIKNKIKEKIKINIVTNCWEYKGARNSNNYGLIYLNGGLIWLAHRLSYFAFKGEIPNKMFICHHCDNPPCCNPDHLFIGNHRTNMLDCISKNRNKKIIGSKNKISKLNEEKVKEIKLRLLNGEKMRRLAKEFNISAPAIRQIKTNKTWKHVTLDNQ